MPDLAESSIEFIDLPVYDEYAPSLDESQIELGGAVIVQYVAAPAPYVPPAVVLPSLVFASDTFSDFGVDVSTYPQLSESLALVTQRRAVAEMAYRRLTTARGQLAFHPDAGRDLRFFLNEAVTDTRIFALREQIEREVERDERVERAVAKVTYDSQSQALDITVEISTAEGTFPLTLRVTQLTVELLETP